MTISVRGFRLRTSIVMQGKFSENDTASWNLQLEQALNYDRLKASERDNGMEYFEFLYLFHL